MILPNLRFDAGTRDSSGKKSFRRLVFRGHKLNGFKMFGGGGKLSLKHVTMHKELSSNPWYLLIGVFLSPS